MVEVYGKEASGKTTLALHIIKEAQKLGGTVLESHSQYICLNRNLGTCY
jgi:RecA/RadA recombinase